jgi:hypothetical protein
MRGGCWVKSMWRGVAKKITECDTPDEELQGGFCYKKCNPGYTGLKEKCYNDCPDHL